MEDSGAITVKTPMKSSRKRVKVEDSSPVKRIKAQIKSSRKQVKVEDSSPVNKRIKTQIKSSPRVKHEDKERLGTSPPPKLRVLSKIRILLP